MTTFEFKMTPRAYYAGWRVLQRQQLRLQWVFCALCAVLAAAGILLYCKMWQRRRCSRH